MKTNTDNVQALYSPTLYAMAIRLLMRPTPASCEDIFQHLTREDKEAHGLSPLLACALDSFINHRLGVSVGDGAGMDPNHYFYVYGKGRVTSQLAQNPKMAIKIFNLVAELMDPHMRLLPVEGKYVCTYASPCSPKTRKVPKTHLKTLDNLGLLTPLQGSKYKLVVPTWRHDQQDHWAPKSLLPYHAALSDCEGTYLVSLRSFGSVNVDFLEDLVLEIKRAIAGACNTARKNSLAQLLYEVECEDNPNATLKCFSGTEDTTETEDTTDPWDYAEYKIGEGYLCAIFNGDTSGMTVCEGLDCGSCEGCVLVEFETRVRDTFGEGHWAQCTDENGENVEGHFTHCDVSGLLSTCHDLWYMINPAQEPQEPEDTTEPVSRVPLATFTQQFSQSFETRINVKDDGEGEFLDPERGLVWARRKGYLDTFKPGYFMVTWTARDGSTVSEDVML